ncbi:MAG: hypothetical protein WDO13_03330 [Verrucomicrobiota bacterium]
MFRRSLTARRAAAALACLAAGTGFGWALDRFSIAPQGPEQLLIAGADGQPVAQLPASTLLRPVTIGAAAFEASYVRDANGEWTAVLAPSGTGPTELSFTVLGRAVDARDAIVTLAFSPDLKSVSVDPGYVGTVDVDSHRLVPHRLADDAPAALPPVPPSAAPTPAPATAVPAPVAPSADIAAAPPAATPAAVETAPAAAAAPKPVSSAPPILASQLTPILAPTTPATPAPAPVHTSTVDASDTPVAAMSTVAVASASRSPGRLFWSEPVTPPNGPAPPAGSDEIRLVEVHGGVDVVQPDGSTQPGTEGQLVASGSTLHTQANASAALFLGGINSARLMPGCELVVTQSVGNAVRRTLLDLHHGAVFTRVGRRDGETQDFEVRTADGSSAAETREMLAFRGTLADLPDNRTARYGSPIDDRRRLFAWASAPAAPGLLRDIPDERFGVLPPAPPPATYFFYPGAGNRLDGALIRHTVFSGFGGSDTSTPGNPDAVLRGVLVMLQPFNVKLNELIARIDSGTATAGEKAFYRNLTAISFSSEHGLLAGGGSSLRDEVRPFFTAEVTPH